MDITSATIATLISSGVAATVSVLLNRSTQIRSLEDQLDSILKISIQFPYLENPKFTKTWNENRDSNDEKYLRYENYCTMVFNFLGRLCDFYKYDLEKIEDFMNVRDWVRLHKDCWQNPSVPYENADSYETKFKKIIENYIK
jgi:hypothetical protein